MALIQPRSRVPIYSYMIGETNSAGNVQIATINFANSILQSDGVTKINNYTLQVSDEGLYELICPISISVATFSGSWTAILEVGINFNFTAYAQSPAISVNGATGLYSILVNLNKNDQFSLRSQAVGTITGHTTRCNMYYNTANPNGGFSNPTITFKRI